MSEGGGGSHDNPRSRRTFLKDVAGLAAAGFAMKHGLDAGTPDIESNRTGTYTRPFEGTRANDIAEGLGFNAGSFFALDADVLNGRKKTAFTRSSTFLEGRLAPIFPPAVMQQELVDTGVAEEMGVPINVIATIRTMESAGNLDASSPDGGEGAFQIVPKYHLEKIIAVAQEAGKEIPQADQTRWRDSLAAGETIDHVPSDPIIAALRDSSISSKVATSIVKSYHDRIVPAENSDYPANSPVTWARALAAYNGGPDEGTKLLQDMPTIAQSYAMNALRFFMNAEIAARLRKQGGPNGISDAAIAKELVSKEIDARAYVYLKTKEGRLGSLAKQHDLLQAIGAKEPGKTEDEPLRSTIQQYYNEYKQGRYSFQFPVSAGLRLWLVQGGDGIYSQSQENENLANYPAAS